MEKSKALFGSAESIVEETRTQPTGMIAERIEPKKVKKIKATRVVKKNMSNNIKMPSSYNK